MACGESLGNARVIAGGRDRLHSLDGDYTIAVCNSCGSGTTLPRLRGDELAAFYPETYGPYVPTTGLLAKISALIVGAQTSQAISNHLAPVASRQAGALLDVGCGRGDLAAAFVARGSNVTGIDPSAQACAAAEAKGVRTKQGTLETVSLEPEAFDAVIFQHSLEHTDDVLRDLAIVRECIRPGGLIAITVPNYGCWESRRFGMNWFHLDLPRHRAHFTRAGLTRALERTGYVVDRLTTSTSSVGLPGTIQYRLVGRCLFPSGLKLRVAGGLCVLVLPIARVLARGVGDPVARCRAYADQPRMNAAV
jgi:SAM-dependent methyltransferase